MEIEKIAIRLPPLERGPANLKGTRPVVLFTEQGLLGAANNPSLAPANLNDLADNYFPQEVDNYSAQALHMPHLLDDVYLVIDRSSSMSEPVSSRDMNSKLAHTSQLMQKLKGGYFQGDTRISLVAFNHQSSLIYTSSNQQEHEEIPHKVSGLVSEGNTRFDGSFDLVSSLISLRNIELNRPTRNLIIFATDGQDLGDRARADQMARALRDLNAGTFLVGVGSDYDQRNIIKLASEFAYSGWIHTPMDDKRADIFGSLIPSFMRDMMTSDNYLRIKAEGDIVSSYNITPAIRGVDQGLFFIGYQQSGIGVCFEKHDNLKLKLLVSEHAKGNDHSTHEIPIIDFADAAAYFDKRAIAEEVLKPLLLLISQMDKDSRALNELKDQYPDLTGFIDQIQLTLEPKDARSRQDSYEAGSRLATSVGDTMTRRGERTDQERSVDFDFKNITLNISGEELHSGNLGPLSRTFDGTLPSEPNFNATNYDNVVPLMGPNLVISGEPGISKFDLSSLMEGESLYIGRHNDCHMKLSNQSVSRHHCKIERRENGLYLVDLRSRNGTFLNGYPIDTENGILLQDGDNIRICDINMKFASGKS